MSVTKSQKTAGAEIRHTLALENLPLSASRVSMPKMPVARLKIIKGRPYYYEIKNIWDPGAKSCRQKSIYLGKELPKGYRLIK